MKNFPSLLYSMICERSEQSPQALAILAVDRQPITYRQLADQIASTARQLNQWGFQRGDRVAVALPNGPEMLSSFLSVSAACACAPLNPAYLVDEFAFSLTDLRAKALILQRGMTPAARAAAGRLGLPVLDLEPDAVHAGLFRLLSDLPADSAIPEPILAEVDDIALLLHTSGTTSHPKIVPITHRNIFYSVGNAEKALGLMSNDRCLNIMPLFNIHGLVAVALASMAAGASIVCTPGFLSYQIMDWFASLSPTWYSAVPSLHQAILSQARLQPGKAKAAHLRFIRSASSPLSLQLARDLESAFDAPVMEALGMTEASGAITVVRMPPPPGKEGTVGIPQGTSKMCAVDEAGKILPNNETGELCLSGENVMGGYENNPQANAASFVNGWLRTGDLGYVDDDGYVFIKGRVKEIINRGGAKISPHEVDEILQRHPAVKQAAAFAISHPTLGEDVAAAVVLHEGQIVSMQELRQFAAASLADFKVPRQIVFVKDIPKNAIGKVQRIGMAEQFKAELDALRERETGEGFGPLTEVEAAIQSIWQEVLGVEHVGIRDDYLVMGGDSIRAAIILMNVNERFHTNLLISDIFDTPTVATMAGVVQARIEAAAPNLAMPLIQQHYQSETQLSPAQASLWLIQQIAPETVAYNFSFIFKLTGGVDQKILERALNELVLRHESLRTVYPSRDGKPYQAVLPFEPFSLPILDYSDLPAEERQRAIHRYAAEHENIPFDLEREISGRYALLHAGPNEDYLYFCAHHINWDAWSHFVFTADLMQLYAACRSGEKPDLPDLPIQYSDYALAHEEWFQGDARSALLEHWKRVLSGDLSTLELPTDRPRPALQTDHGARYHYHMSPSLSAQVKEFCRRERMMPFHLLVAAYALLLGRYSGQEDIIFGCPFANRPRPEQGGLIGLFTNVLPLRLNLGGDPSARELFQQARSVMLEALTWQALPFAALVNALAPQRDLSRTPIYNVAINMMNVPRRSTSIPGLELGEVHRDEMPAQFDMTFEFADEGDHFSGSVIFNIDLYDKSTIARMASHFENILEGMLAGADHPVSSVEMLSESERHQMLVEWNVTETDYPSRYCLHEWIEQQVAKTPDAPAVSFDGRTLSYRELNQRANQLAHTLRGLGVGAETLVALYLERSLEMIVGLLGILKAGGAYVPIDPVYPMERRAFILKDSATPVVLTLRRMTENLPKCEARVVCIDLDDEIFTIAPDENLPNVANPENLAYIIYTSGSTGTPKGVMVTHHNVVRLFQATQPWYHFDSNDVWTMFHSYAFDFSVWEIWGALIYGGRVVVVSYLVSRSPETFYQLVKEEGVTVLNQTPSAFYQFIQADAADGKGTQLKLRFVIFGGDALDLQALRPWFERHGDLEPQLVNMYGITETTVHVTYRPIHMRDLDEKMGSMIGQPIPDLQVYLLDNHQNLCPTGVTGEIYVGGAGVARGYLRRDSLTVEKFIADPFRPAENHRLYKSGDLARRLPNGDLEYLGRSDFQIKIRGFRVELGEIESLLMKYPGIQQAMVMLREDQPGDKRLAGYIIPSAGTVLEASPLREYLKSKLPVYMVPSAFICMDAFPLTPNGKVDRKRLPAPELGDVLHHDYIPPRTPTEQSLSKIWMEVLGLSRVGIADDFFEIGGDSLSAVQVMSRLQRELEIKLPIYKIFEFSRLADLAAQLELALRQQEQNAGDRETFGL